MEENCDINSYGKVVSKTSNRIHYRLAADILNERRNENARISGKRN